MLLVGVLVASYISCLAAFFGSVIGVLMGKLVAAKFPLMGTAESSDWAQLLSESCLFI